MDAVKLEKAPKIAVYSPKGKQPWDDAVTLVLTYAEIPYTVIYDEEIIRGDLHLYDWLHLHHEDFTGQYGRFYAAYRNADWYRAQVQSSEEAAQQLALAAEGVDICERMYDGDSADPTAQSKLDFQKTFAFKDFVLTKNPMQYEFSSIDATPVHSRTPQQMDLFTLFEYSAKWDPVPSMLTQNHTRVIKGFMGQTTAYDKKFVKPEILVLGENKSLSSVKYLHGKFGKGQFTFYGGHDPEDYQHFVGDPPTDLNLHPNSPGYRLILNNVLFPAAKKKKQKT